MGLCGTRLGRILGLGPNRKCFAISLAYRYSIFAFRDGSGKDESKIELAEERSRVYNALEDLDSEYESGKLSDEDYQQLRQKLLSKIESDSATSEKVSELRSTTPEQPLKDSVEAEIAKYKARRRDSR